MANGNPFDEMNMDKFMEILSKILSKKYGCKITMTAIPKNQVMQESAREAESAEQKAG